MAFGSNSQHSQRQEVQEVAVGNPLGPIPSRLLVTYKDGSRVGLIISRNVADALRESGVPYIEQG